ASRLRPRRAGIHLSHGVPPHGSRLARPAAKAAGRLAGTTAVVISRIHGLTRFPHPTYFSPDARCFQILQVTYAPRAARTRSDANGSSRNRTPVSAAIALPTAPATVGSPSSPAPVGRCSVEITLTSMLGASDMRATW